MNIRPLENKDLNAVKEMMEEHPLQFPRFIIDKYPPRWRNILHSKVDSEINGYYVACTETDGIIGHAGYIFDNVTGLFEIVGVVVKMDFQRKGIGKALIDSICMRVKGFGGKKVILYTLGHPGNESTISFYQNIGFVDSQQ
ncbi:GNAT family N-acetyltransferase [Bacillus suaedae]|uniref:GNAT family N-acetyltransferase n=1 Tax=Halalkalibacter suaedae TaxID=2822140 RepID=A0A940WSU6_9BACI|nr:GNAT family N-acetyltransferase [Bacillus suaedae]MBP3951860.1 GNAT family N-acetyltransferase [Bacillus suaedae]